MIEQRPDHMAAHVDAPFDRVADGRNVGAQIVATQRVVDAVGAGLGRVVEGGAVFGDVDADVAESVAEPDKHVGQCGGVNFTVGGCGGGVLGEDRKSVVEGKRVSGRVELGGGRINK